MKVNITVDLNDFYSEFEDCGEWLKETVRDELKKDVMKTLRKDERYKELISLHVTKYLETL